MNAEITSRAPVAKTAIMALAALTISGCPADINNYYQYTIEQPNEQSSDIDTGTEQVPSSDTASDDIYDEAPDVTVDHIEDLKINLFEDGNSYFLVATDQEVADLNTEYTTGSYDWYQYQVENNTDLTIDSFYATSASSGDTAKNSPTGAKLIGESSGMELKPDTIPNVRINLDAVNDDARLQGYDNIIFRNGMIGGLLREDLVTHILPLMNYSIPKTAFAYVNGNVWGGNVTIPYVVKQDYDGDYEKDYGSSYGGGIEGSWEMVGDFGSWMQEPQCELSSCNEARFTELEDRILNYVPKDGIGLMDATADIIDWESDVGILADTCTNYIMGIGDDYYRNSNNVRFVLGSDGLFRVMKSSWDISFGQEWYPTVSLTGWTSLTAKCQTDMDCAMAMIDTCEAKYDEFVAADPAGILNERYAKLQELGMERSSDAGTLEEMQAYIAERIANIPSELEIYRRCFIRSLSAAEGYKGGGGGDGGYYGGEC